MAEEPNMASRMAHLFQPDDTCPNGPNGRAEWVWELAMSSTILIDRKETNMPTLLKKLTRSARAGFRCRRRPRTNREEPGSLRLLEEFISGYLPEAKAVRTRDARGRLALEIRVAGRPPWVLTPATGLLSLGAHQVANGPAAGESGF